MTTPMEFRIYPRGLRLLVPEGNLEAASDATPATSASASCSTSQGDDQGVPDQRASTRSKPMSWKDKGRSW